MRFRSKPIATWAALVAGLVPAMARGAELLECVAVEVNGDIVTLTDVVKAKKAVLEEIYRQKLEEAAAQERIAQAKARLLDDLIEERLMLQKARETGISATREEVDRIVRSIMEQNGIPDETALERALQTEGMTVALLRGNIERRSTIEKVKQYEVASKIVVTDDEARKFYDAQRDDFREPERVRLREIVLLVEKRDPEQVRKEITEISNLVKNGADFAELATLFSQAPSAERGGDLGLVRATDLATDIRDTAAQLEVGQVSAAIQTRYGFHILKLVERKAVTYQTFEAARDEITRRIQESRYGDRFVSYMEGLKRSAFIRRHDDCAAKGM